MRTEYRQIGRLDQDAEERQDIGRNIRGIVRKAYRNVRLRTALLVVFALTWWGILYPELCFTEDTLQQVIVVNGVERTVSEADYMEIMDAAGDEIVIGSRLLEWLEERNWFRRGG